MSAGRIPETVASAFTGVALVALAWYTLLTNALPLYVPGGPIVFVDGYKGVSCGGVLPWWGVSCPDSHATLNAGNAR
jgi:hypothetical protein